MKLLLIGMGPGIGLSIARRFGREGFEILMVARNADKLRAFSETLNAEGIKNSTYAVDIADIPKYRTFLEQVVREHPDINVLQYNASAYNPAKPSEIDLDVFINDLHINVTGALLSAQAVMPQMKSRAAGTIYLTGGGTALQAPAVLASLGMGKAAMRNLVFSLADECRPLGIQVATITICGMVQPGSRFDPDEIADKFWQLYSKPGKDDEVEIIWK